MITRVLSCLALAACSAPTIPAMHPASGAPRPAGAGEASVVFVRPPSSCDTSDYPTIVDENGRFVGNAGSNTAFVVRVPAGRHAFYAWPNIDLRRVRFPDYDPVGAVVVDAVAGGVTRIAILIPRWPALNCASRATFQLVTGGEDAAARAEIEAWSRDATLVQPDADAGNDDLHRTAAVACAHLAAGRRRLRAPAPATCAIATPATTEQER